ncbi:helix-turn-helix domain-containing protein [Paenibacillus roseipurpureus]|uniref:Helix-turn-helix domain-containing protein n=1 Tax=Paenibacillus roseopurpureus TaxID=2918901 RepID=A0AA96LQ90_9BACL|nr:helix-turn-helix domain-containing protein [Paenibacillus sp. MBLB1832]WNR46005.1 helix-turn-helix domain-containing protein [Paenibacillus sp. MBLB1832]
MNIKGKLQSRLLISLLLLSSIPVALLGFLSSYISNKIITEQINQMHSTYLKQVEIEMNGVFKKFDELMLQYTYANNSLLKFTNEELTYKNFSMLLEIYGVLANLRSGMEHVSEIDFFSIPQQRVYTSTSILLSAEEFEDRQAIKEANNVYKYGIWLDTRQSINTRLPASAITYIRPINNGNLTNANAAFILYLDAGSLSSKLRASSQDPASYYVVNESGQILLHSDPSAIHTSLSKELMNEIRKSQDQNGYQFMTKKTPVPALINSVYSPGKSWYYVSSVPVSVITAKTSHLRLLLYSISALFILIAALISIKTTSTLYSPLQRLVQTVLKQKKVGAGQDEIHSLYTYIQDVERDNAHLQKDVQQYQRENDNYSLLRLLLGNSNDTETSVSPFTEQSLTLTLVETDPSYLDSSYNRKDQFLFYYAIENMAGEIFGKDGPAATIMVEPGLFAIISQRKEMQGPLSTTDADKLLQAIRNYLRLNCTGSMSYSEGGLAGLHTAYQQARQALRYSLALGYNQVMISDELDASVTSDVETLSELESSIMEALHHGRITEAREAFSQLIERIREVNIQSVGKNTTYMTQLLGTLLHTVRKSEIAYQASFNRKQLAASISQLGSIDEIRNFWDEEIFEKLIVEAPGSELNQEQLVIDQVLQYIHTHYDKDISLLTCAELVQLSTFQLSRAFKKVMSVNFVDYVIEYRIQIAKDLLIQPAMTIQTISDKLRYTSVNSFIRTFKKVTGMTPGQYRKDVVSG